MTLQTLPQAILWPGLTLSWVGTPGSAAGQTLDAAGEYLGAVICAQEDMTITEIVWRPNSVSGSPTADVRIETVDPATGLPTGTLWAANTNLVTGTLTAAMRSDALTASATIAKGEMFCVKFAYNSGTNFTVRILSNAPNANLPYKVFNIGTPTKIESNLPLVGLFHAGGMYSVPRLWPVQTFISNTFNNTNSAARGNRFQVPFKCRVSGMSILQGASLGDFNIALYDDAGATLLSTAVEGDITAGAVRPKLIFFDSVVELDPGVWYRMAVEPSSATNVNEYVFEMFTSQGLQAMPGGANFAYATRASGTWTDDTDSLCIMDLLIDQLDDGAGGGGGTGISRARAFGGFA